MSLYSVRTQKEYWLLGMLQNPTLKDDSQVILMGIVTLEIRTLARINPMYLEGTRLNHSAKVTRYNKYIKYVISLVQNRIVGHRIRSPFRVADLGSFALYH